MPAVKFRLKVWSRPSSSGSEIRPAMAPESSIETSTIFLALTPPADAAVADSPDARSSKPNRVRFIMIQ